MGIDVSKIVYTYDHPIDYNKVIYELEDGTRITVDKDEITSADQLASSIFWADSDGDGEGDTYIFSGLKNAQIMGAQDVNSKIIVYNSENISVKTSCGNDEVTFLDSRGCSAEDEGGQNTYVIGTGSENTVVYDSFNTNTYYNFGDITQINDYGGDDTYHSRGKTPYAGYILPELSYDLGEDGQIREKYNVCSGGFVSGYYFKDTGDFYDYEGEPLGKISDYVFINDEDDFKSVQDGDMHTANALIDEKIRAFVFQTVGETAATISEPTETPTPSVSATSDMAVEETTETPAPIQTPVPTQTPAPTASLTPTETPAPIQTPAPTASLTPTETPAPSATPIPSATVSATPEPSSPSATQTIPPDEPAETVQDAARKPLDITTAARKSDRETFELLKACKEVGDDYCILPNGVKINFNDKPGEDAIREYMYDNIWQDENGLWHIENLKNAKIEGTDGDDTIIINNAENLVVKAKNGDDTIIIDGKCSNLDIYGDDGNDTIMNNADLQTGDTKGLKFGGQGGDDTIINYGSGAKLWGDGGYDAFINYGNNVKIDDGAEYDIITDFGSNTETVKDSSKLYTKGIDPKSTVKDETATIEITLERQGNDYAEFNITYIQNGKTKTASILLSKENGAPTISQEELQSKIFVSQDGILCFDAVDNATITGTTEDDRILVQNSEGVTLNGYDGNDAMVLYNCKRSTVNGQGGDDMLSIINDEELSKEDANTAVGADGKDTFIIKSKYATIDFGADSSKDFLLSYNSAKEITLKNEDTTSGAPDSKIYLTVDANGNITKAQTPSSTSSGATVPVSAQNTRLFTGYDPFSGLATSGTSSYNPAISSYSPTGAFPSGALFTGYDPLGTSNFALSPNYGSGGFSSFDFSFGSCAGFTFTQDPFTGLGLTSPTQAVQKVLDEAEAKKKEAEEQE